MNIVMSLEEMMVGAQVGIIRRISSISEKLNSKKHSDISDWATDIDGAIAEMAFAKFKNVYWSCSNMSFKNPDVGNWQVRSTSYSNGHLIIRPNDKDTQRDYVLVIVKDQDCRIVGYMKCGEARKDRYWKEDSWWVPQSHLTAFPESIEQKSSEPEVQFAV